MNNSLTKASHIGLIEELSKEHQVELLNPLSQDLNGMRQSLIFMDWTTLHTTLIVKILT